MPPFTLNGKRALAVDDEPDILEVLTEIILTQYPDCEVEAASTYEEGLEKLTLHSFDLVILDIMGVSPNPL